jgi:F0F1-type ATP synthase gamma subunit
MLLFLKREMEIYFSQFWNLVSSRSRYQQIWCLKKVHRWHLLTLTSMADGEIEPSGSSFIRALILFLRAP